MKISIPEHVVHQEFAGEYTLLHTLRDEMYHLDDIASDFWQRIKTHDGNFDAIWQAMQAKYEVSPAQLRQDLQELVDYLEAEALLSTKP